MNLAEIQFQLVGFMHGVNVPDHLAEKTTTLDINSITAFQFDTINHAVITVLILDRWYRIMPISVSVDTFIEDWKKVRSVK